jgi:hypothetical protein
MKRGRIGQELLLTRSLLKRCFSEEEIDFLFQQQEFAGAFDLISSPRDAVNLIELGADLITDANWFGTLTSSKREHKHCKK